MKEEKHGFNLSKSYDAVYGEETIELKEAQFNRPQNREEALIKWSGSGKHLLEIGFARGYVLYNLRNRFEKLYGLEISMRRAEKVQNAFYQKGVKNVEIMIGDIEKGLDFPDGYFDCIIWADVIEHIIDIWSAMQEIHRLLQKGGHLLTITPNFAEWRRRLKLLVGRFPSTSGSNEGIDVRRGELFDGGHMHYFTFSMLEKLYRKYNIVSQQRYGFGRLGRLRNLWPSLLTGAVCVRGLKQD